MTPAAASQLLITTQPNSSVAAGSQFGFIVTAEDQYGNVATGFNGNETIAVATGPAGGTLTGTTARDGAKRCRQRHRLDPHDGRQRLHTASFESRPDFRHDQRHHGDAAHGLEVCFTTQPPSSVVAGAPFGLTVTAEDTFGNQATSFNTSVSIGLSHNPGTGTLGGTLSQQASSGVAQFSGLTLNTVGTGYTITATNGTLTSFPSNPINVTPATATTLVVSIPPPTTMTSGAPFGLAIAALDQFGNLATGYTGTVTIALDNNPGNATLGGPLTATAVGGVANFHAFITTETAASGYTCRRPRRADAGDDGADHRHTGAGDASRCDHATAVARYAGQHVRVCRRRRGRLRQHLDRLYRHDLGGGTERMVQSWEEPRRSRPQWRGHVQRAHAHRVERWRLRCRSPAMD